MNIPVQKTQQGFTLIELMIVVGIIGILASVAIPSYQTYTKKAHFTEVILAASAAKAGVEMCAQILAGIANCTNGLNGVPNDITTAAGGVGKVETLAGVITVTPSSSVGGISAGETYVLTPTYTAGKVNWAVGGGCATAGLCSS